MKISPSKIINYYYPMPEIDEEILKRAGLRGKIVHKFIENYFNNKKNDKEKFLKEKNNKILNEKDLEKIKQMIENIDSSDLKEKLKSKEQELYIETNKLKGFVDFIGEEEEEKLIIDWKTNSKLDKEEIEKYTIQINLYRYMYEKKFRKKIENLYIYHITNNKNINKIKKIKCSLIPNEKLEKMIDEVYDYYKKKNQNEGKIEMENTNNKVIEKKTETTPEKTMFKITKNINEKKNKLIIILGEPKTGKTTLANEIGNYYGDSLYIEIGKDNGYAVLDENIDMIINQIENDFEKGIHAGKKLELLLDDIINNSNNYSDKKTLILDPINNIQEEMQFFIEKNKGKQMSIQEWGIIKKQYDIIQEKILKLLENYNIILLSHIKTTEQTDTITDEKTCKIIPLMTEANGKTFTKIADAIIYTTSTNNIKNNKVEYGMIIGGHPLLPTGIRTNKKEIQDRIPSESIPPKWSGIDELVWK